MRIYLKLLATISVALFCAELSAQDHAPAGFSAPARLQIEARVMADDFPGIYMYNLCIGAGCRFNDYNYLGLHVGIPSGEKSRDGVALYDHTPVFLNYTWYIPYNIEHSRNFFYSGLKLGAKFGSSAELYKVLITSNGTSQEYNTFSSTHYVNPYIKVKCGMDFHLTDKLSLDAEVDYGISGFGAGIALVVKL